MSGLTEVNEKELDEWFALNYVTLIWQPTVDGRPTYLAVYPEEPGSLARHTVQALNKFQAKLLIEYFWGIRKDEQKHARLKDLEERIEWALDNCPVCSKKAGAAQLCEICLALRNGQWQLPAKLPDEPFQVRTPRGIKSFEEWYRQ